MWLEHFLHGMVWGAVSYVLTFALFQLIRRQRRRYQASKPPMPDVLLPLGWFVWHWDSERNLAYRWKWTGRAWKRTNATPIEPLDVPELSEHK